MEIEQVRQIATTFLQRTYGIKLTIPIERNNRLRTTQGRYVMNHNYTPVRIDISGHTLDYGTDEAITGIIKHECIHYALHMLHKPYKDGTDYFEAELKKYGAPATGTCFIGKVYTFTCNNCGKESETRRKQLKLTPKKYLTTCCGAKLTWTGEKIYDGSSKVVAR